MIKLSRLLDVRRVRSRQARRFFDAAYYRTEYPDVAADGGDPFTHYIQHGWREGRDPSAVFSTLYYKDRYLAEAPDNPLLHYSKLSEVERLRRPTSPGADFVDIQAGVIAPYFDVKAYVDVAGLEDGDKPLHHYLTVGWRKGLEPSADFSSDSYLRRNSQVRRLQLSPLYHFISTYPLLHPGKQLPETDLRAHWAPENRDDASAAEIYEAISQNFDKHY